MTIAPHFQFRRNATAVVLALLGLAAGLAAGASPAPFAALDPPAAPAGYLARLLINEAPFPGEKGYISETNTRPPWKPCAGWCTAAAFNSPGLHPGGNRRRAGVT